MAQSIVLKRSALPGKVPGTGSLDLGEIALNTYDGKVYLKKSSSIESIESIVTTNSTTTGSITLLGTGSFGELVVKQDANFQRDIFVTRDIIGNGDLDILGNITGSNLLVYGTITAKQMVISSSVTNITTQFASGSTRFGDTLDDTHQFTGSVYISGAIYLNGNDLRLAQGGNGAFTGSFTGSFVGDGTGLTGITASMRPDDFDFNSEPFAGTIGYIQATGSLYKVATTTNAVEFRYNDIVFANATQTNGFSINGGINVTGSIIPQGSALHDLGSLSNPFKHLYVSTGSIYFVGANGNVASTMSVSNNGLALDGDIRLSGSIWGSSATSSIYMRGDARFTGSVSASTFIGLGNLTEFSQSVNNRISNLTSNQGFASSASFNAFTSSYLLDSASFDTRIIAATNEGQFATTGSNYFVAQQYISGNLNITGSIIPSNGTSFDLGSQTNNWRNVYVSGAVQIGYSLTQTYMIESSVLNNNTISTVNTGSYMGAFYNYTLSNGVNSRAGQMMAIWNNGGISFTETLTTDIGDTSAVNFNAAINGGQVQLVANTATTGWKIRLIQQFI